jgi:hypothetical protein
VVSINSGTVLRPQTLPRLPGPRPLLFIIDRPRLGLLVVVLVALALVVAGALAADFLSLSRGTDLVCAAPTA